MDKRITKQAEMKSVMLNQEAFYPDGGIYFDKKPYFPTPPPPPPPDREKTPPRLIGYHEPINYPAKWKIWSIGWTIAGAFISLSQFVDKVPR